MRYKEISLNGLCEVTASDIVDVLIDTASVLYDIDYVELFGHSPEIDLDLNYGEKHGYETFEIELIIDGNIHPFYINTENISGVDDDGLNFSELDKSIKELFFRELKKLDELYKK